MTLILGMRVQGGVIIAADSVTAGEHERRADDRKIYVLPGLVWAAGGHSSNIDEFAVAVRSEPGMIWEAAWHLERATAMAERNKALAARGNDHLDDRPWPNVIFTDGVRLAQVTQDGAMWGHQSYTVSGPCDDVAYYLIRKQWRPDLTPEEGVALAIFALTEAAAETVWAAPPINVEFVPAGA